MELVNMRNCQDKIDKQYLTMEKNRSQKAFQLQEVTYAIYNNKCDFNTLIFNNMHKIQLRTNGGILILLCVLYPLNNQI